MKALPVIIGIVVILTLVSLPGAAMVSKDDLLASLLPVQNTLPMFFCGDCGSESPYVLAEGTGIFVAPQPYDPLISKDDLMGSYPVPQFADLYFDVDDGIWKQPEESSYSCCDDDTFRGHMTYTIKDTDDGGSSPESAPSTPTPVPYDSADDSDCSECREPGVYCGCDHGPSSGSVPVNISPCVRGICPEPTPVPTKPTPTPSPLTLDVYHIGVWIYPHIPASYYEWSKFPPEPTPRVISDEEWEEAMA